MSNSCSNDYRFGFNGQEKDQEIYNNQSTTTATFWEYDGRIGRRWNVDPATKEYPNQSPYAAFNNNPLSFTDPLGDDPPEKEKKEIKRAFKKAIEQSAKKEGESLFNESVEPAAEKETSATNSTTAVNSKVNIEGSNSKWTSWGDDRKFDDNISLEEKAITNAQVYYKPGKDASYNVITKVDFIGKYARPLDGVGGNWVQLKGNNNRLVGSLLFKTDKDYKTFKAQYNKIVQETVLKQAKSYDQKSGTTYYEKWKSYYNSIK